MKEKLVLVVACGLAVMGWALFFSPAAILPAPVHAQVSNNRLVSEDGDTGLETWRATCPACQAPRVVKVYRNNAVIVGCPECFLAYYVVGSECKIWGTGTDESAEEEDSEVGTEEEAEGDCGP